MATFGAHDAATAVAALAMFESDNTVRTALANTGIFILGVKKAHDAGDTERLAALIEGVDLEAEAQAHLAQPGVREKAQETYNRVMGNVIDRAIAGGNL